MLNWDICLQANTDGIGPYNLLMCTLFDIPTSIIRPIAFALWSSVVGLEQRNISLFPHPNSMSRSSWILRVPMILDQDHLHFWIGGNQRRLMTKGWYIEHVLQSIPTKCQYSPTETEYFYWARLPCSPAALLNQNAFAWVLLSRSPPTYWVWIPFPGPPMSRYVLCLRTPCHL